MVTKKSGKIIIITGPSGVGKGTLINELINKPHLNLTYSISHTTRKPRKGEINGKDYHFVSKDEFEKMIKRNEFLEFAIYNDNYYGTSIKNVEKIVDKNENLILEIEIVGVKQVLEKNFKNIISIFILPQSINELQKRLEKRATEDLAAIKKRIEIAKKELKQKEMFQYKIKHIDTNKTVAKIEKIIKPKNE